MLTTKQVRAIMHKHIVTNYWNNIWTNRWKNSGQIRSVKCYLPSNPGPLLKELRKRAGAENVSVTPGSIWNNISGITVRCVLE